MKAKLTFDNNASTQESDYDKVTLSMNCIRGEGVALFLVYLAKLLSCCHLNERDMCIMLCKEVAENFVDDEESNRFWQKFGKEVWLVDEDIEIIRKAREEVIRKAREEVHGEPARPV